MTRFRDFLNAFEPLSPDDTAFDSIVRPDWVGYNVPYYGKSGIRDGGDQIFTGVLSREHLEYAKQILDSFDLVLLTEKPRTPDVQDYSNAVLNVSRCRYETLNVSPNGNTQHIPDEIKHSLMRRNVFDLELYGFAEKLLSKRIRHHSRSAGYNSNDDSSGIG